MTDRILIFYGSYRGDRMGIRLADYCVRRFSERGADVELIDAKEVGLPMLDRMYKEYDAGEAPEALEALAGKIKGADAFVFVTGEYNWNVQPGLKNLTDHFLEEWFWRPAAIASYSAGRTAGVRSALAWRGILGEMGMAVISSSLAVGSIGVSALVGPSRPNPTKLAAYECGNEPLADVKGTRFSVKFYMVAIMFLIFDIETVFLYPWAVVYRSLGWFGVVQMAVFLGILGIAFVYEIGRGGLKWD